MKRLRKVKANQKLYFKKRVAFATRFYLLINPCNRADNGSSP